MKITYLIGDVTHPLENGLKIIPHVCNDIGLWGSGVVMAISKRWKEPEIEYRKIEKYLLGSVQFIPVSENIIVANMIGQHGVGYNKVNPPIRYDAVRTALISVNNLCEKIGATIHAPRFGAGLAGGNWNEIEKIIVDVCTVPVFIYDLPNLKD